MFEISYKKLILTKNLVFTNDNKTYHAYSEFYKLIFNLNYIVSFLKEYLYIFILPSFYK